MIDPRDRFVQEPDQALYDYVLEPYTPRAPLQGLHSVSVLRWFLRRQGWTERVWPVLERLRELLGPGKTVWGVKDLPGLELYFYNHGDAACMSVERLSAALRGLVQVDSRAPGPYLMCSLELDGQARTEGFRIYVAGRPEEHSPDGTSYLVQGERLELENLYWFYPPQQLARVVTHLKRSVHARGMARSMLPRELLDCHTLCFANKRHSDAVYFSRIDTARAAAWLAGPWPEVAELLAAHQHELAHLCWDIGLDVSHGRAGKVGLYGFW